MTMQLKQNEETNQLNEEEVIEAELDKQYRKKEEKEGFLKRKFKPFLKGKEFLADNELLANATKAAAYLSFVVTAGLYATEVLAVDIEAAAKAGVKPLRNTIVWIEPYLLGFAGMAGAYFTEGDLKTKAVKTVIGVGALWAVSSALLSWMPNIA